MTAQGEATSAPPVSVVIPTRDRLEMLRTAVDAVLAQEYDGPVEVVVVVDKAGGPSPEEAALARSDPGRRVTVIRNERSPGLAGARNSGVLASVGTLVAFCDDDDVWRPGKLAVQVPLMTATPAPSLVSCGIAVEYGDETFERSLGDRDVRLADLLRDRLTELHPSTFLLRRADLVDADAGIGLVDEAIPGSYAEDYEFLLRAARHAPVANVGAVLVDVRWHQRSYFSQRWDTIASALTWLLERYPEFATERGGKARVTGQIAFANAALGRPRAAARWSARTLRLNPRQPRAYLALAVAAHAVSADRVMRALHERGRGL